MHSNKREECCLRTLVNRKRKRYDNAVDVVVRLHDRPILAPKIRHIHDLHTFGSVMSHELTIYPAECRGRASSARRCDDGDDEATGVGLRLSTKTICPRWIMVEGALHTAKTMINLCVYGVPLRRI